MIMLGRGPDTLCTCTVLCHCNGSVWQYSDAAMSELPQETNLHLSCRLHRMTATTGSRRKVTQWTGRLW